MYYNGWTRDTYVACVFLFAPNGCISIAAWNAPGHIHDSALADMGNVYKSLNDVYRKYGGKCVADSAFSTTYPFIIKSSQETDTDDYDQNFVNLQATCMRQSAKWGMRSLKASFPRLKDRIIYEEKGERKLILDLIIYLHNYKTMKIGINEILNKYMPIYELDAKDLLKLH